MKPLITLNFVLGTCLFLTACSGGPSNSDVKVMFEKATDSAYSVADDDSSDSDITRKITNSLMPKIKSVKGTEC